MISSGREFVLERRHRFVTVGDVIDHLCVRVFDCMVGFQRRHLDLLIVELDYAAVRVWSMTRFTIFREVRAGVCELVY